MPKSPGEGECTVDGLRTGGGGGGGLGQGAGADLAAMAILVAGEKKREDIGSKPVLTTIQTRKVLMFFFYLL